MTDTNHHVLTGKVDITSNLLVGSSHLFVDTNNNRVGLVTTNPDAGLHVNSNAYVNTDLRVGSQIEINATAGRVKAASFEGDGSLLENIPAGADGAAATIGTPTITTGLAGTEASVTNSGTSSAAVFDFVIPRGDAGTNGNNGTNGNDGEDGAAATIEDPTITTGLAGTEASVTNSGTSSAAVFDFVIPRGDPGTPGTNGTNYFTLSGSDIYRNTGNVGIGTTSPNNSLHIYKAAAEGTSGLFIEKASGGAETTAALFFGVNAPGENPGVAKAAIFYERNLVNGRGDLKFCNDASSDANAVTTEAADTRMIIKNNGDVGIGTTSPSAKLDVRGNIIGEGIAYNHKFYGGFSGNSSNSSTTYTDAASITYTPLDRDGAGFYIVCEAWFDWGAAGYFTDDFRVAIRNSGNTELDYMTPKFINQGGGGARYGHRNLLGYVTVNPGNANTQTFKLSHKRSSGDDANYVFKATLKFKVYQILI